MANLRLTALEKNFGDTTPKTPSALSKATDEASIIYSDIKFDITNIATSGIYRNNPINSLVNNRDISKLTNEEAVVNSVKNWFKTKRYSHLLNPEMELDLNRYLFEPLDYYTAYFLALDITTILPIYEPRINIDLCKVTLDYDRDAFIVSIAISIPALDNKKVNISELIDHSGRTVF